MKILFYRFLDATGSAWCRYWKIRRLRAKWGDRWRDMSRTGRKYSRVYLREADTGFGPAGAFHFRPQPGWEWRCPNCKEYSIIREVDMPYIIKEWEERAAVAVSRGYKAPKRPTAATAGCTNCKFLPGAPE